MKSEELIVKKRSKEKRLPLKKSEEATYSKKTFDQKDFYLKSLGAKS